MIVLGDPTAAAEIGRAAGIVHNPNADKCIARIEHGWLMGGLIFNSYTGASIGIHAAGFTPHWYNRDMLWVTFHYPFVQLGVARIFLQIPSDNARSLAFATNLGFKIVAVIEGVFRDADCVILRLDKDECRWLSIVPRELKPNVGGLSRGQQEQGTESTRLFRPH